MEQWIYARLYESAFKIMENANKEFYNIDLPDDNDEIYEDFAYTLIKAAFVIGKILRKGE